MVGYVFSLVLANDIFRHSFGDMFLFAVKCKPIFETFQNFFYMTFNKLNNTCNSDKLCRCFNLYLYISEVLFISQTSSIERAHIYLL